MARKIQMLILREMLIRKDQYGVFCEGFVNRDVIGRLDRL